MKPRLNSLAWMPRRKPWTGRLVRIEAKLNGAKSREILDENLVWSTQDLRHSQYKAGVDSRKVSECPWVAQPEPALEHDRTSLERPENSCAATLPIQPDRAWEDLQRRMGEALQIQVFPACSVIPKKTQCCNRCQRCFNNVPSKRSEYLFWYFSFMIMQYNMEDLWLTTSVGSEIYTGRICLMFSQSIWTFDPLSFLMVGEMRTLNTALIC